MGLSCFLISACSPAKEVGAEDVSVLECYAAMASIDIINTVIRRASSGDPLPDGLNLKVVPEWLKPQYERALDAVKKEFPASPNHVSEYERILSDNLGIIGDGLSSKDFSFAEALENKTQPCKDDYPS